MSLALICPDRDLRAWRQALAEQAPDVTVVVWPEIADPAAVEMAVVWRHPPGLLRQFPRLRCISSLGAGVDGLLADPDLPEGVPLTRIVDPELQQSMAEYVCQAALSHFRQMASYRQQQRQRLWQVLPQPQISTAQVGILGYGQLGAFVGGRLQALGFPVQGLRRRDAELAGKLADFLAATDILVCLLPLTAETRGILNLQLFQQLRPGACLIQVARGEHLVEEDLLTALAAGFVSAATLDVFHDEPLPPGHPFWEHPQITITPHCSAITNPATAVPQILENYRRLHQGAALLHQVDIARGY